MTVTKESSFIKEFKEMAFTLDVGQVSKPFKSEFWISYYATA